MRQKIIFIITMMLALVVGQLRAQTKTAYAVYCENSKELHFLCSDDDNLSSVEIGGETVTLAFTEGNINAWKGEAVTNAGGMAPGWNSKSSDVTKVVFESTFADAVVMRCSAWFYIFSKLTTVTGLEYLNTSQVTNMSNMFNKCSSLTSLDLSSFKTSKVNLMGGMFEGCSSLTSLDLSSFDTSSVTKMKGMFRDCSSLTFLDLSSFDTSNVTNINNLEYLFDDCSSLKFLDLSKATGEKIPDMIGTLPEDVSPVIFVPSGTTLPKGRKNVISGDGSGECDNLEINAFSLTSLSFPYSFTANKITVSRGFKADKPHTLYLPFAMDAKKYGTFYTLKEYDKENQKVVFSKIEDGMTTANTPYLFVPNENTANNGQIVIDGGNIEVKATTDATQPETGLIGVYKKYTFDDTNKANCYGWANGEFLRAGSGASVGACRAYLKLPAESVNGKAPARLSIQLGEGATGITAVKGGTDGDTDAPMYNLQGQRVDKSYRGVVIKNGKKMIVK